MAEQPEPKVTIDGKEYNLADLSDEAQAQVQSLQFVEAELVRANAMVAEVGILTGKQTVMDYILTPILKVKDRAFRE